LAWRDLLLFEKARERAHWNMNTASDHDVLKLASLNEMTHLTLRESDTRGELFRRF
jgi:hypothetical protein